MVFDHISKYLNLFNNYVDGLESASVGWINSGISCRLETQLDIPRDIEWGEVLREGLIYNLKLSQTYGRVAKCDELLGPVIPYLSSLYAYLKTSYDCVSTNYDVYMPFYQECHQLCQTILNRFMNGVNFRMLDPYVIVGMYLARPLLPPVIPIVKYYNCQLNAKPACLFSMANTADGLLDTSRRVPYLLTADHNNARSIILDIDSQPSVVLYAIKHIPAIIITTNNIITGIIRYKTFMSKSTQKYHNAML
jgi:hypothetical protein